MESFYYQNNKSSNKSTKMAKQKSPSGSISVTPLVARYLSSSSSTSSSNSRSPQSIVSKYSSSSSGGSSNTNTNPFSVVDEESVFVMDGILVDSSYKMEEFGKCRFATKSQFGHGKEDLRSPRFPIVKNKSEAQICKSFITGSCVYGSKCRFIHQVMTDSALVLATQMDSPIKPENASTKTYVTPIKTTTFIATKDYWLPCDDGIEVSLPSHIGKPPSRENVKAYIDSVLYCPTAARKRLPVFAEICPQD